MPNLNGIYVGNDLYTIPSGGSYTAGSGIDITNSVISQKGDVTTDEIMSDTLVNGQSVELATFSTQDNYWHIANTKVDDSLIVESDITATNITGNITSTGATSGQVLTADGNGSSDWSTMIAGAEIDSDDNLSFSATSGVAGVSSLGGATGAITLGTGLTMSNNELSASGGGTTLNLYTYTGSSSERLYKILNNCKRLMGCRRSTVYGSSTYATDFNIFYRYAISETRTAIYLTGNYWNASGGYTTHAQCGVSVIYDTSTGYQVNINGGSVFKWDTSTSAYITTGVVPNQSANWTVVYYNDTEIT